MEKNIVSARHMPVEPTSSTFRHKLRARHAVDAQVMVPDVVDIPLPKPARQQIAVPASVNGRDLSAGRP